MIAFACSNCGMKFKVKDEFAGRSTRCPTCKQPVVVPASEQTLAMVDSGQIDGTQSSLARAGVDGGVTLGQAVAAPAGQKTVADLLARRSKNGERYIIEKEIAHGGMGVVLRAVDCDIRREVAVKYMLGHTDYKKNLRFVEEAQITGQLEHPNIVPIHELGLDSQKRLFFSMKMVNGRSLAGVLEELGSEPKTAEKRYSLGKLLNVIVNVCNALAYAHSRNVIHRDLKPANIMLGDFGEVYVMDWGLAKVLQNASQAEPPRAIIVPMGRAAAPFDFSASPTNNGPSSHTRKIVTSREGEADLTQNGAILGTPVYMPPEQAAGKDLDQRCDIYALGAILYEMLTLKPPVERPVDGAGGYLAILMQVVEGKIVPPEKRSPRRARAGKIPGELSAIAMKALALRPQDRYQTVEALRRDIERFQEGRSVSAKDDTKREMLLKFVKRNKGLSAATFAGFLVACVILVFSFTINYQARLRAEDNYASFTKEQEAKHERGKKSAPLFVRDARVSGDNGQIDYALAQVNVALDFDPDMAEARLLKGQLLIVKKDFAGAKKELAEYMRQKPDDIDAHLLLDLCSADPGLRADASAMAAFAEVFASQKAFGLAMQMDDDKERLLDVYRQQIEAGWPGLGGRLQMNNGKCQLNLDNSVQLKDLNPLKGIPLDWLSLAGCHQVQDLTPLTGMPLTTLNLASCPISDLRPLDGMRLSSLNLGGCGRVQDLKPLKGMPLLTLDLTACSRVEDLSSIKDIKLALLSLNGCVQVRDLAPLKHMPLTSLHLGGCKQIKDLTPLKGMKKLTFLNIDGCNEVPDLSPLKGLPLTELRCGQTQLTDLSLLRGMKLMSLGLAYLPIEDLTPLNDMRLTSLDLSWCNQIQDLTPLKDMRLDLLSLAGCERVSDLTPLKGVPLTSLYLYGCKHVQDLTPLKDMPLKSLGLWGCNQIKSLTPLKGMRLTTLRDFPNDQRLFNELKLLRGMPLRSLCMLGCDQIQDLAPLQGMNLTEIYLTPKNITKNLDVLRPMKSLQAIAIDRYDGNKRFTPEKFWKKYDAGEFK